MLTTALALEGIKAVNSGSAISVEGSHPKIVAASNPTAKNLDKIFIMFLLVVSQK
jgi:hypothetical protein